MLDTGIDVPEVVNLVFFKLVRSKTKFWQMIGRGTRLCPDLFGPNQDKLGFFVFDLCQNIEYFNQDFPPVEGTLPPSLGQRLFQRRADLILALDERYPHGAPEPPAEPDPATDAGMRWGIAHRLRQEVAGMNVDNFLVRPHRQQVEAYADIKSWHRVTAEAHAEIVDHLAPLPSQHREADDSEEAKRFDLLVLRLQLAHLGAEPGYERLRTQVRDIASALLDQSTIPAIRAAQELLDELTTDQWWEDVTLPMLESMRRRVRGLVRLIERTRRGVVYADFEDHLGEVAAIDLRGVSLGTDRPRFEAKVRNCLRSHEDHLAVQKLRRNRQITATDLSELERIFVESAVGTADDVARAKQRYGGLGLFVRSLTGLEREAATAAFDRFQSGKAYSAGQLLPRGRHRAGGDGAQAHRGNRHSGVTGRVAGRGCAVAAAPAGPGLAAPADAVPAGRGSRWGQPRRERQPGRLGLAMECRTGVLDCWRDRAVTVLFAGGAGVDAARARAGCPARVDRPGGVEFG
jgi:type I restriction enzyme R subunit